MQDRSPDTFIFPQNAFIVMCQVINLAPPPRVRAWGWPLEARGTPVLVRVTWMSTSWNPRQKASTDCHQNHDTLGLSRVPVNTTGRNMSLPSGQEILHLTCYTLYHLRLLSSRFIYPSLLVTWTPVAQSISTTVFVGGRSVFKPHRSVSVLHNTNQTKPYCLTLLFTPSLMERRKKRVSCLSKRRSHEIVRTQHPGHGDRKLVTTLLIYG